MPRTVCPDALLIHPVTYTATVGIPLLSCATLTLEEDIQYFLNRARLTVCWHLLARRLHNRGQIRPGDWQPPGEVELKERRRAGGVLKSGQSDSMTTCQQERTL